MAAATMASSPIGSLAPPDAQPFERHILALLTQILQEPSPSFPFPTGDQIGGTATSTPDLPRYDGEKTKAQSAIESAIIALGERAGGPERRPSPATATASQGSLMTPDWTPPPVESYPPSRTASGASTATSRPPLSSDNSTTPTSFSSTHSSYSHRPSERSMSVDQSSKGYGWGKTASQAGAMTAEKELALLRAQVQDIARVCKVSYIHRCKGAVQLT